METAMSASQSSSFSRFWANLAGGLALALWAAESTLVVYLSEIPPLQLIAMVGTIGFLATLARMLYVGNLSALKQPPKIWLIGTISFALIQACYATAFQFAPPAGVDLIYYLWPIEVIIFSSFLLGDRFTGNHIIATCLAMVGMMLFFVDLFRSTEYIWQPSHLIGYGLAGVASFAWTIYTLLARKYSDLPSSMIGGYMGVSALITACAHFILEETVVPTLEQSLFILFYGTHLVGLAYCCWDYGLKNGNYQMLSILSYTVPLGALCCLIGAGLAVPTPCLLIACACVTVSAFFTLISEVRSFNEDKGFISIDETS